MASIHANAEAGQPAGLALGRRLYQGWLELAAHFGEVQTLLIVCLVYAVGLGPVALVSRVAGRDLLAKRGFADGASAWNSADSTAQPDVERAKRQF